LKSSAPGKRDLDRLSEMLFDRISARLEALAEEPRPAGAEKLAGLEARSAFGPAIIESLTKWTTPLGS